MQSRRRPVPSRRPAPAGTPSRLGNGPTGPGCPAPRPAVRAAFLEWLLKAIQALPDPARQTVAANGVALEAISATPLDAADQERYRKLISEAFGAHPQIAFETDPALIAGLELHGPHLVVSNSWRADLTQILADLAHDNRR